MSPTTFLYVPVDPGLLPLAQCAERARTLLRSFFPEAEISDQYRDEIQFFPEVNGLGVTDPGAACLTEFQLDPLSSVLEIPVTQLSRRF